MEEPDFFALFVRPLRERGLRYLIAGSMGSMYYGEPRLTMDIDLAVAIPTADLPALSECFPSPDFYCPPLEILEVENRRECRGHFSVIHIASGYKADFYPSNGDAFYTWAWENRRSAPTRGVTVDYAPPEYIIVWKVAYYAEGGGEKHVRDIRRMFDLSSAQIDEAFLEKELERRGLLKAYSDLRTS